LISIADRVPAVGVKRVARDETTDVDTAEYLGEGRVVLFTVPGAFTPTCHNNHLPGFVGMADRLAEAGIDRIVCATVNDHHVTRAWAESQNALGGIEFIADFDAAFARALGLDKDMTAGGLGTRFQRAALIIENGTVTHLFREEQRGQVTNSGAPAVLDALKKKSADAA